MDSEKAAHDRLFGLENVWKMNTLDTINLIRIIVQQDEYNYEKFVYYIMQH